MHDGSLIVSEENVVSVWHFRVFGQKMRRDVQLSQFLQDLRLAIAEPDVPRHFARANNVRHIFDALEQLPQRFEFRLELKKLALIVECIERNRVLHVQMPQESVREEALGPPAGCGALDDDRLRRISVFLNDTGEI